MSSISLEYAKALYELLSTKDSKQEMLENLETSISIFGGDLRKFFLHPEISKDEKKKIVLNSFEKGLIRDFILVLIDNDRLSILEEIKDDFNELLNNDKNIVEVIVYSKEKLDKNYLDSLKEKLEKKLEKDITLFNEIDSSIIGGIRIQYESKEIDLTLNSKMNDLISKLKE